MSAAPSSQQQPGVRTPDQAVQAGTPEGSVARRARRVPTSQPSRQFKPPIRLPPTPGSDSLGGSDTACK